MKATVAQVALNQTLSMQLKLENEEKAQELKNATLLLEEGKAPSEEAQQRWEKMHRYMRMKQKEREQQER